ncbi:6-phosphogluconolactonase [Nodosilinea nodulosa]|uniref:6-phosphogluconolactonase n=1 Tax=Nodosilinea nodulosa TaxID=416001 RepID=UPI000300293E|nr:6-phosphogluconolactonase [Nodosilinea nodulosa]
MQSLNSTIQTFADPKSLTHAAVIRFVQIARDAIETRDRFTVALSGGSTPKALYALLATQPWQNQISWVQVYLFWGDERHVPPSDPSSNFRMVQEQLLFKVPIPLENIHRIKAEYPDANVAAIEYERELKHFFQLSDREFPRFDLVLLGMGANGHTASLFPGTAATHEQTRLVASPWVEEVNSDRITLTPPVINAAREVIFFVTGLEKAATLKAVLEGQYQPDRLPAQIIRPTQGNLTWMVDQAAANWLSTVVESISG